MYMKKNDYEQAWGKYNPMAQEFFTKKAQRRFYKLNVVADIDFEICWQLSDEQVARIREDIAYFLRENPDVKEIEPDDMAEVLDATGVFTPDFYTELQLFSNRYEYGCGEVYRVDGVDLDNPRTSYRFGIVYMNEFSDEPCRSRINISMSDEQYVRLLTYMLINRNLRVQDLKGVDDELYTLIMEGVENREETVFHSYMVLMPEVNEDAEAILGEKYHSKSWTVEDKSGVETVCLTMNEKMLMIQGFVRKEGVEPVECRYPDIYIVPIQDMLGAQSYEELAQTLKKKFGHMDGLAEMVAWCRENGWLTKID